MKNLHSYYRNSSIYIEKVQRQSDAKIPTFFSTFVKTAKDLRETVILQRTKANFPRRLKKITVEWIALSGAGCSKGV